MKPIPIVEAEPLAWCERPFVDYMCEVDRLLHEQFGVTVDDLDAVAAAQEQGESPQELVDWIAEHYHLEPLPR